MPSKKPNGTLEFKLCNGYTNQLLAFYYGAILAQETNRVLILPDAIIDGKQSTSANNMGGGSVLVPMSGLWNEKDLAEALRLNYVKFTSKPDDQTIIHQHTITEQEERGDLITAITSRSTDPHVKISCPLLKISSRVAEKYRDLLFDLAAVPPSPKIARLARKERDRIADGGSGFNFLHVRVEDDWVRHCGEW
jgi:hypothetical protein